MEIKEMLTILNLDCCKDYTVISNYEYKYTLHFFDGKIIKTNDTERHYLNINNETTKITVDNNVFNKEFIKKNNFNRVKRKYQKKCRKYLKKIMCIISNSKLSYEIKLSYNYDNRKIIEKAKYKNYYFEIYLCCFDKIRKINKEVTYLFKHINYKKIMNILNNMTNGNLYPVDTEIGIIKNERIIFESYAFSQLINKIISFIDHNKLINNKKIIFKSEPLNKKLPHYKVFDKDGNILNDFNLLDSTNNVSCRNFENCIFDFDDKTSNLKDELKTGYIITKMYFSYGALDVNKNIIKAQCSGLYFDENKIVNTFSNKLLTINLVLLFNNIIKVSEDKFFSNNILCPDVLVDLKE